VLGLGKKRNKRKKQNSSDIRSTPRTALTQSMRFANPQPARPAAKLQGYVWPLGILAEIPNSEIKAS